MTKTRKCQIKQCSVGIMYEICTGNGMYCTQFLLYKLATIVRVLWIIMCNHDSTTVSLPCYWRTVLILEYSSIREVAIVARTYIIMPKIYCTRLRDYNPSFT
jgi:hypothetical protein